jgi:hypothetical protein
LVRGLRKQVADHLRREDITAVLIKENPMLV